MNRLKIIFSISAAVLLLVACGAQGEETQAIPEVPSGSLPGIEIVAGAPNTCAMADTTQSTVMGFDVIYHNMGTDFYMVGVMSAPDIGKIGGVEAAGEGRDGEGNWGIYPQSYKLAPNTPITLKITVYAGVDEITPVSSTSSLTYDCTTGDTISAAFENPSN